MKKQGGEEQCVCACAHVSFCFSSCAMFLSFTSFLLHSTHSQTHTCWHKMHFFHFALSSLRLFASHVVFSLFTFIIHSTSWLTDPISLSAVLCICSYFLLLPPCTFTVASASFQRPHSVSYIPISLLLVLFFFLPLLLLAFPLYPLSLVPRSLHHHSLPYIIL
jgi:hypothetical protein